jgi:hypothetical protein
MLHSTSCARTHWARAHQLRSHRHLALSVNRSHGTVTSRRSHPHLFSGGVFRLGAERCVAPACEMLDVWSITAAVT